MKNEQTKMIPNSEMSRNCVTQRFDHIKNTELSEIRIDQKFINTAAHLDEKV